MDYKIRICDKDSIPFVTKFFKMLKVKEKIHKKDYKHKWIVLHCFDDISKQIVLLDTYNTNELSLCHKLRCSNPYIFATQCRGP